MKHTFYPRLDEQVRRHRLSNGLEVCVVKKPGFARKCAYFVTDFGSVHTSFTLDGKTVTTPAGVAHYLEHKMFDMPDGRDITEEFAALGANVNAFTTYDMTAYYFSCTERFQESLELLLEFVSTPYFTEESVDKERPIIAQEILMYDDSPESRLFEEMNRMLYRHHPLREPISGTVESIEEITPELLYECYRAFYRPGNMMLCVAGDVDENEVLAVAERMLPRESGAPVQVHLGPEEEMAPVENLRRFFMDVAMPGFQLGIKCPAGRTGEDFAHWELVAELACEALMGESSGLYLRLYEEGLIDSAFGWGVETITGSAMVVVGGDSYQAEQVRDAILEEAARLARTGISREEFTRMKRSFLGRRVKDLDSFESTCYRLCAYHFEGFDYLRFPEQFDSVRVEELQEFLRDYILADRCAMAIVEPRQGKEEE
ncbi:MAG: insulinase family protein [Oscillospiraceae bacterium]|nr:insulinase family protein [Oscillospiraceae bacterium]